MDVDGSIEASRIGGRWRVTVRQVHEPTADGLWRSHFEAAWPHYEAWLRRSRWERVDSPGAVRRRFRLDMPELWPTYERLVDLASDAGPLVERFLTLRDPPPFLAGCSLVALHGDEPVLIRNYDYAPWLWEACLWHSKWCDSRVLASLDCLWGALDGMNEHGLAVALAFGGRRIVGPGYGIPLLVRYLLEVCTSVTECREALSGMRSHMAYSLLAMDRDGGTLVAELAPDRPPLFRVADVLTNHQEIVDWPEYLVTSRSCERLERLERLADSPLTVAEIAAAFRRPPLRFSRYSRGFGTLYTAIYRVSSRTLELLWPTGSTLIEMDSPHDEETEIEYAEAAGSGSPRGQIDHHLQPGSISS